MNIVQEILDFGIGGGAIIVFTYIIIQQQLNFKDTIKALTEILNRMESRLATLEEIDRQTIDCLKDIREKGNEVNESIAYCRQASKLKR